MKLLKTIGKKDPNRKYTTRKAARALVFDKDGKMALLYVSRNNYYKLPGGGIDEGETIEEGLKRECVEEIGCDVLIIKPVGRIVEYRHYPDGRNEDQESFCYIAEVKGEKGKPKFEQGEIDAGFKECWVAKEKVVKLLKENKPIDYFQGDFIVRRDLTFVEEGLRVIDK